MSSLRVFLIKVNILENLRIVFFLDENSSEIYSKCQGFHVVLEYKTYQYYFLVSIVTYHQKQQNCFHNFLMVEFRLMFEL